MRVWGAGVRGGGRRIFPFFFFFLDPLENVDRSIPYVYTDMVCTIQYRCIISRY